MNSSNPNPVPPTWVFIAFDIGAIGIAAAIALRSPHPLSTTAVLWIVALVILGAIVGLVPLVMRYERQKNEILDERQFQLEGLARTVGSSAEQISIAAKGLHDIAELSLKNIRHAEQLPHKLQDKIAEFQSQIATANDAEKEELERELLALRTTESERLESVSQRIAKSSAEWARLEAATNQHLTAANEAVAKLAFSTASAIGKAQAAAEQALAQARVEASRSLGDASGHAVRAIESAKSDALAEFDAKLDAAAALLVDRMTAELKGKLASPEKRAPSAAEAPAEGSGAAGAVTPAGSSPAAGESISPGPAAQPPRRPRKLRRDESPASGTTDERSSSAPDASRPPATTAPPTEPPSALPRDEPLPVPASKIPEIAPVAPPTAEPFSGHATKASNGSASPLSPEPASPVLSAADPKSARKRASKKSGGADEPALGLELDDTSAGFVPAKSERVLTSDGATRLLVTAYIGIGNRLFIRGHGPGLSWEKGVPLQFVSIGKWRWETNDANEPVQFKLYKNDDLECAMLGALSLDPGHQQEVTAAF